ncbi:hypothetical protein C8F04DRAFT_1130928 [Mycena alexandri]|uniref:Uncharacterized protein n=1 Tax=Mycena alexandri TaxID=1745969 RepID=A0AAD6SBE0_9AGAR|nr:hypothetical protein C8F04DRAFT_1130928 [Mycena alexandri]
MPLLCAYAHFRSLSVPVRRHYLDITPLIHRSRTHRSSRISRHPTSARCVIPRYCGTAARTAGPPTPSLCTALAAYRACALIGGAVAYPAARPVAHPPPIPISTPSPRRGRRVGPAGSSTVPPCTLGRTLAAARGVAREAPFRANTRAVWDNATTPASVRMRPVRHCPSRHSACEACTARCSGRCIPLPQRALACSTRGGTECALWGRHTLFPSPSSAPALRTPGGWELARRSRCLF